ncbi:MAG: hypothetical protein QOG97_537 [Acidimicrobiaceae bacterium]|jgi:hypothetical protein|nr:hypothetical protein [Acidimicrobiaceae bacterium]
MTGDDYAMAFAPDPRRCYRYVCTDDAGRPGPCPDAVRWRGQYRSGGRWWTVRSCDRHAEAITNRHLADGNDSPTTSADRRSPTVTATATDA